MLQVVRQNNSSVRNLRINPQLSQMLDVDLGYRPSVKIEEAKNADDKNIAIAELDNAIELLGKAIDEKLLEETAARALKNAEIDNSRAAYIENIGNNSYLKNNDKFQKAKNYLTMRELVSIDSFVQRMSK